MTLVKILIDYASIGGKPPEPPLPSSDSFFIRPPMGTQSLVKVRVYKGEAVQGFGFLRVRVFEG